jgi:hypothetical protein
MKTNLLIAALTAAGFAGVAATANYLQPETPAAPQVAPAPLLLPAAEQAPPKVQQAGGWVIYYNSTDGCFGITAAGGSMQPGNNSVIGTYNSYTEALAAYPAACLTCGNPQPGVRAFGKIRYDGSVRQP